MKRLFYFALGFCLAPLVVQWFILRTREPVRCDGGEGQRNVGIEDLMSDVSIDA